jgi:glucose-6-phosphate 1-epimerase
MYDINELNQRFGAAGRIAFRIAENGMPIMLLVNSHGSCEESLYGGQVLSYRPMGHTPVLFKSRESFQEAGKQIRGGIPLCWPWFGAPPSSGLPRHGFARLVSWDLLSTQYDSKLTEASIYITDNEQTKTLWPHSFELVQKISLSDNLSIEVTTLNKGNEPFELSQSIHPYIKVRDIENVSVSGVEDCKFTDLFTKKSNLQNGPLSIDKETYYIYGNGKNACAIRDTGLGRNIALTYSGMKNLVVWNPWIEKSSELEDLGDNEYKGMLTLAPATLPEEKMVLQPNEKITIKNSVQATLI